MSYLAFSIQAISALWLGSKEKYNLNSIDCNNNITMLNVKTHTNCSTVIYRIINFKFYKFYICFQFLSFLSTLAPQYPSLCVYI